MKQQLKRIVPKAFWPSLYLERLVMKRSGGCIISGPFKDLKYIRQSFGSALIPKLLGLYERELHPVLNEIIDAGFDRIINVGAAAAAKAGTGMGAYAASKAAVAKLTEALAEELKDKGVNVNAVLPTIIDTPANRADMPKADFARWVEPQALADVIIFLSSRAARAITGASILVAGRV